jgi:CRP-like cAMP-binding protein
VQVEGSAFRIDAGVLKEILNHNQALDRRLQQFSQILTMEVTQLAACNRLHEVNERLARWLLTCADRIHSDSVPLTQELLSHMLGTRRSSVTVAAGMLEQAGLISNARGRVDIIHRGKLEQAACDCYGMIRTQREEWLNESG